MRVRLLAPIAALMFLHCSGTPNNPTDGGSDVVVTHDATTGDATPDVVTPTDAPVDNTPDHIPTWYGDIAPFAYTACGGCHIAGGIGPFDITSWTAVHSRGPLIASRTMDRTMPPMPVDNSGSCHTFSNARYLTDAQIALVQAWAANGMLEGDPATAPPNPTPLPGLTNPNVHLDIGLDFTPVAPAGLTDEYRCFIVDPGVATDTYITGYEVIPGDPRIVHHVIVYSLPDAAAETAAQSLEAMDSMPGYECFGGSGVGNSEPLALWAPGGGPTVFPNGTGLLLNGGRHVVVQIHYNLIAGTYPDRTRVNMITSDATTITRAYFAPILDANLTLPPGMANVSASQNIPLTMLPIPVRIYGAAPHMHTMGQSLRVETTGTTPRCIVDTPRWDFHWQGLWWYDTPVRVSPSDTLRITCNYNTTGRTSDTHWGESTSDEMCLTYFYVAP